jgi:hypothetical protein
VAVGGDQDVGGAQVEVGKAGVVGCLEGVEQLQAELGDPADREGAVAGHQLVKGQALDQLADHVDGAVLDDHVVQADQPGSGQGGRDPRLGGDPLPQLRLPGIGRVRRRREVELLDRQPPAAAQLGGPPAHPAPGAAQSGLQRPAARDEPLAGVG